MRSVILDTASGGVNRQRTKGGAKPASFYDIVNGYVDATGRVVARDGFGVVTALPAGAKGLCAHNDKLHTFVAAAVTYSDPLVVPHILIHPSPADDYTPVLKTIWYANVIIGALYVVAEFTDGNVFHYWLQDAPAWQADQQYNVDAVVQPSTATGFLYKIANSQFPQAWQPGKTYSVNDVVVPTTLNGWKYTCIEADGDNPSSGTTEPAWPTSDGATVTEEHDEGGGTTKPPQRPPPDPGGSRYGNMGGGGGGGGTGSKLRYELK